MSSIIAPEVAQPAIEARERLLRCIRDEATIHGNWVKSTEAHLPMAFWRARRCSLNSCGRFSR